MCNLDKRCGILPLIGITSGSLGTNHATTVPDEHKVTRNDTTISNFHRKCPLFIMFRVDAGTVRFTHTVEHGREMHNGQYPSENKKMTGMGGLKKKILSLHE